MLALQDVVEGSKFGLYKKESVCRADVRVSDIALTKLE